jgi:hypothetical protein
MKLYRIRAKRADLIPADPTGHISLRATRHHPAILAVHDLPGVLRSLFSGTRA